MAFCGFGSRRSVESLIVAGKVKVNGEVCKEFNWRINPREDKVEVDGKVAEYLEEKIYLMINKPPGYLVSHNDAFGRKLVYDLVPDFGVHLFAVGRLDLMSQGLLLLTSDGDFANKVIHPSYKLEKVYKVEVDGYFTGEMAKILRSGVEIDGIKTFPAKVYINKATRDGSTLKIVIQEGRKRQIRRMISSVGLNVTKLTRLQIGGLHIGSLPMGMWKFLDERQIKKIFSLRENKKL